jgi:hypothetical protein
MGQIFLPGQLNFQATPADLDLQNILSRMYPVPAPAYRWPLGMNPQGLGDACNCMSVSDLVAACGGSGTGGCNPLDSGCVADQAAIVDYAETVQDANWTGGCGPCIPPNTPCGYTSPGTAANTAALMANQPLYTPAAGTPNGPQASATPYVTESYAVPGGVVYAFSDGSEGGTSVWGSPCPSGMSKCGTNNACCASGSAAPAAPIVPAVPAKIATATQPPTTPTVPMATGISTTGANLASQTGSSSSGTTSTSTSTSGTTTTASWFTDPTQEIISGIPNWGLVAAAALGVFMFAESSGAKR